mgnify:CR=1 FL=1
MAAFHDLNHTPLYQLSGREVFDSLTTQFNAALGDLAALGVRVRRSLVVGLVFIFVWEQFVARASHSVRRFTITGPLRFTVASSRERMVTMLKMRASDSPRRSRQRASSSLISGA